MYIVYIVICTCSSRCVRCVQIVHSLYDTTVCCCTYCTKSLRHNCRYALRPKKGTRTVPFLTQPCGACYFCDWAKSGYMYILYIVPGDTTVAVLRPEKGTRTVPLFYLALRGFLLFDLVKNKSGSPFYLWTQGPPVNTCKIFTHDHLWLVIVILKSQSRRLLHSCIVLCVLAYVLCFLGALARGLFLKKTHSG